MFLTKLDRLALLNQLRDRIKAEAEEVPSNGDEWRKGHDWAFGFVLGEIDKMIKKEEK